LFAIFTQKGRVLTFSRRSSVCHRQRYLGCGLRGCWRRPTTECRC